MLIAHYCCKYQMLITMVTTPNMCLKIIVNVGCI